MNERVSVRYDPGDLANTVCCTIEVHDPSLRGHSAELLLRRTVTVHDERAVNASDIVFQRNIPNLAAGQQVEIHRSALRAFSYTGTHISIALETELQIDDGLVFDTKISRSEQDMLLEKPAVSNDAKEMVDPRDAFDFITNFKAIPPRNKAITALLVLIAAIVVAINSWVGVHDQFAPEEATWLYSHRDSDGDSESPLQKSLMGSGALGVAVWFAIRQQLRKYMTFELVDLPARVSRGDFLQAASILHGKSRVDLHDVMIRIVACNMEKGQYRRGSGTKVRTVSFTEPVRAVILYDRRIRVIPAGTAVESHLDGVIDFEPMFQTLFPPQEVGSTHGLIVHWEVQLIHDQLVDQEVICSTDCFAWKDFLAS